LDSMADRINPWADDLIDNYDSLFKQFGLQPMPEALASRLGRHSRLFRRGMVFAHRDFDKYASASEAGKKSAVMSGIKPSGDFHLGSKMTAEEIVFIQKEFGAKAFYCIADLEAYADNGMPLAEGAEVAVDNVADLLALGLDDKNATIYKQSESKAVSNLAFLFAKKTTLNTLEALYGHQNLGLYQSVLVQAGDILHPQLKETGAYGNVVVPVGIDQDPHMRFTRDVAYKFRDELGLALPASTYHRTFRSLNGESKMSKRDPMNMLTLNDKEEDVRKKVARVFTGGRATVAEQKKLGGEYVKCVNAELDWMHFEEDDAAVADRTRKCLAGEIMCGECKKEIAEKIVKWLKAHQERKHKSRAKAEKLLSQAGAQ
jgi:tryptophanyl-tRNA synthetase